MSRGYLPPVQIGTLLLRRRGAALDENSAQLLQAAAGAPRKIAITFEGRIVPQQPITDRYTANRTVPNVPGHVVTSQVTATDSKTEILAASPPPQPTKHEPEGGHFSIAASWSVFSCR